MMKRIFSLVLTMVLLLTMLPVSAQASGKKLVALTFDDGPHKTYTGQLLDGLKELGAKATFFMIGQNASYYPDVVQRVYDEGHEVANHTWSHATLTKLSYSGVQSELNKTKTVLDKACGADTKYLMRPPGGSYNSTTKSAAGMPIIYWSVDTNDWKYKNYSHVYNHIVNNASDGAIILCHDIHKTTIPAALDAIKTLQARGYEFVTVSELFRRKGSSLSNGSVYSKCTGTTLYGAVQAPVITYTSEAAGLRVSITSPSGAPVYISLNDDNARWVSGSTKYTGSFLVTKPTKIRAVAAYNLNGGRSEESALEIKTLPSLQPQAKLTGSSLTLTTKTQGANIYYTLDGTTPTVRSTLYQGPIQLQPGTLIRAIAGGSYYSPSRELVMYYSPNGHLFADVLPGKWYTEIIDQMVTEGLMKGLGDYIFEPNGSLTRAMMVEMLYRYDGQVKEDSWTRTNTFPDVPDGKWYAQSVEWAYANGIVEGYPEGDFRPDQAVTRQEMAEIIHAFLAYRGSPLPEGADCREQFTDGEDLSGWALKSMNAVVDAGLIIGNELGQLLPKSGATRAQLAAVFLRMREFEYANPVLQ